MQIKHSQDMHPALDMIYKKTDQLDCEPNEDQIKNVKAILLCFEVVSGLKINFFKSELIGI